MSSSAASNFGPGVAARRRLGRGLAVLAWLAVATALLVLGSSRPGAPAAETAGIVPSILTTPVTVAQAAPPMRGSVDDVTVGAAEIEAPADPALAGVIADPSRPRPGAAASFPVRFETAPRTLGGGSPLRPPRAA